MKPPHSHHLVNQMASSKLSGRRRTTKKPAPCISLPPIGPYPPERFDINWHFAWTDPYGDWSFATTLTLTRSGNEWAVDVFLAGINYTGLLTVAEDGLTAYLELNAAHPQESCFVEKLAIPLELSTHTFHHITVWDDISPPDGVSTAHFLF